MHVVFVIFGAHAFIWGTTSTSVRQRAVPTIGGVAASIGGVTAPFWFAFAGSAIILALIWRSLLHIAHTDENLRAGPSADQT